MALSQRLELRQSQTLVMTPQLMQAIKLLQLSNLDLAAYVDAELERNPLLERSEAPEDGSAKVPDEAGELPGEETGSDPGDNGLWAEVGQEAGGDAGEANGLREGADLNPVAPAAGEVDPAAGNIDDRREADLANEFPDDHDRPADEVRPDLPGESWAQAGSHQPVSGGDYNLEAFVASDKTLADHLEEQLGLATTDPQVRLVAHALINEIDESGYLGVELDDFARRLGIGIDEAEGALELLQTLDPPGIGARDLAECLALQLRERDRLDPAMRVFISHLDLVARRDFTRLKTLCGVDREDLGDMLAELRSLDPKPGAAFTGSTAQIIVPDVLVRPAPDGSWLIELNQDALPRVLVNRAYAGRVTGRAGSDEERAYLGECMQSANWLVKSLDQRARTILKVASEIVRQQDGFLLQGVQHLRPLNLKAVADAIGMHESTISRVTSNKYMATHRGIFELKYFFTAAIAASGAGEAHSAEAVRDRIRRLIEAETPDNILSDDAIVTALAGDGIEIARRTVAKYREAMRIASSVQRRREKRSQS